MIYHLRIFQINKKNILGHSDVSYARKKDPGEKFPWELFAKKNLSLWHNISQTKLASFRNKKVSKIEKKNFYSNLKKNSYIGNEKLLKRIKKKEIKAHELATMSVYDIYPENAHGTIGTPSKDKNGVRYITYPVIRVPWLDCFVRVPKKK